MDTHEEMLEKYKDVKKHVIFMRENNISRRKDIDEATMMVEKLEANGFDTDGKARDNLTKMEKLYENGLEITRLSEIAIEKIELQLDEHDLHRDELTDEEKDHLKDENNNKTIII